MIETANGATPAVKNTAKKGKPEKVTDPRVQQLRQMFRNFHAFRALYETDGVSEITAPDGTRWSLWDLEELYRVAVKTNLLPFRQRQAIELFLVLNLSEEKVATLLSIRPSNPIGMYASSGIVHLLREIDTGSIINPWLDVERGEVG